MKPENVKLPFPDAALDHHMIDLGKTGSGKSSKMRVIGEHLLTQGRPVCFIDPKGDWYGLRTSADGKRAGFPVVIFGGAHADVPINEHSGAQVGELLAAGNRPALIDLGGWMVGERTRFFIGFAAAFFKYARGARHLVIDEVHNFAPQGRIMDPDAGKMLHWANRLASEGRGKGITIIAASQRPQKVHKDFITSCKTLIACKVIHKLDRDAIKDWIDGCADPSKGREVLTSLAQLKKPQAWVWSPEIDFGPELLSFPMFSTYDSFKPQAADAGKLAGWAEVDLQEVSAKLAAVVEEQKANDPAQLRKKIADLERQLRSTPTAGASRADLNGAEQQGYERGRQSGIQEAQRAAAVHLKGLRSAAHQAIESALSVAPPPPQSRPQPAPAVASAAPARQAPRTEPAPAPRPDGGTSDAAIGSGGKLRILIALAQYPEGMGTRKLSILTDISQKGGTWRIYMAELRSRGFIDGGKDHMRITDAGLDALGTYEPLPTGVALIEYWRTRLGNSGKRAIFDAVVSAYPHDIDQDDVSHQTAIARTGGTWRIYLAELRGLGLIEGKGELRASEDLFS